MTVVPDELAITCQKAQGRGTARAAFRALAHPDVDSSISVSRPACRRSPFQSPLSCCRSRRTAARPAGPARGSRSPSADRGGARGRRAGGCLGCRRRRPGSGGLLSRVRPRPGRGVCVWSRWIDRQSGSAPWGRSMWSHLSTFHCPSSFLTRKATILTLYPSRPWEVLYRWRRFCISGLFSSAQ